MRAVPFGFDREPLGCRILKSNCKNNGKPELRLSRKLTFIFNYLYFSINGIDALESIILPEAVLWIAKFNFLLKKLSSVDNGDRKFHRSVNGRPKRKLPPGRKNNLFVETYRYRITMDRHSRDRYIRTLLMLILILRPPPCQYVQIVAWKKSSAQSVDSLRTFTHWTEIIYGTAPGSLLSEVLWFY